MSTAFRFERREVGAGTEASAEAGGAEEVEAGPGGLVGLRAAGVAAGVAVGLDEPVRTWPCLVFMCFCSMLGLLYVASHSLQLSVGTTSV